MDIKESDILGDKIGEHWYYISKYRALKKLLQNHRFGTILDVGAGSGYFSKQLLKDGFATHVICVDTAYEKDWDEAVEGGVIQFRREVSEPQADLVLLMDVLEHVEDDVCLLKEYTSGLGEEAMVIVSVPAFQWLFSQHDKFLEHVRRYTKSGIKETVKSANLFPTHTCFMFGIFFPLIAVRRLLDKLTVAGRSTAQSDLRIHSKLVNAALIAIHKIEVLFFKMNGLFGLSIFCLARKSAD